MNDESPTELSRILWNLIIGSGRTAKTPTVEQIASRTGRAASTLYAYLEGRLDMPYLVFRAIYQVMADHGCAPVEAMRFIVHDCDPDLFVGNIQDRGTADGCFDDDLRRLTIATGHMVERIDIAERDGRIDATEDRGIREAVDKVRDVLDGLTTELVRHRGIIRTAVGVHVTKMGA